MHAQDYYRIINEVGRSKLGHPYLACFKSCVTTLATQMSDENFPIGDKFGVVLDRNQFQEEAIRLFAQLKADKSWPY
jgi:hypothetical protein